jgi:hypothetical protein
VVTASPEEDEARRRGLLRLPTALRIALYVAVPTAAYGLLVGGLYLKRWRDEAREREQAAQMQEQAQGITGQLSVLVQQVQIETAHVEDLRQALAAISPEDPRRPALQQQLDDANVQLARTQQALFRAPFGGRPPPTLGSSASGGDPIH